MKPYIIFLLFNIHLLVNAQTITGIVKDTDQEPLIGATIMIIQSTQGTSTDEQGNFSVSINQLPVQLIISYVGFQADTIDINTYEPIIVTLTTSSLLDEITVTGQSTFIDPIDPKYQQIITEKELLKAACCNLSESFETNTSVDVSYTDAISGAKQIQMLGLDGIYVQINRENIPNIRGLTSRYGMGIIPGTSIQSIDVGKGAGSVVNGFESMVGQINVELKKPDSKEKLYLNAYANQFGRMELNANVFKTMNKNISNGTLFHASLLNTETDRNEDGFLDQPKSRQLSILHRWKFSKNNWMSQWGISAVYDEKAGGQNGFNFNDETLTNLLYGYSNIVKKIEAFGKTGLLFPQKPHKGLGIIYSFSHQSITSGFGRRYYEGKENTAYLNIIYQSIIQNTNHQFKSGINTFQDQYDENFDDSTFFRNEKNIGFFYEYSFFGIPNATIVAGYRFDMHNLLFNIHTYRIHAKYDLPKNWSLRLSAGNGTRIPNVFADNNTLFVSNRKLILRNSPQTEQSINYGMSFINEFQLSKHNGSFSVDYFFTNFQNKVIFDMENAESLIIKNVNNLSSAHSFQSEFNYSLSASIQVKTAYKYYWVTSLLGESEKEVPFISKNRFFFNLAYASRFDRLKVDITTQYFGRKRLPEGESSEWTLPSYTPAYFIFNGQISRGYRWGDVYVGVENAGDYRQKAPIIAAEEPFGPHFDASMVWAPIIGRIIYTGIHFKIKS